MTRVPVLLAVAVAASISSLSACSGGGGFIECEDQSSCDLNPGGQCLLNESTGHSFCAYPDPDCPSGMRWSDLDVEDSISGMCVAEAPPDAGVDNEPPTLLSTSPADGDP